MKILFITNFYPPAPYGWGYMQLCEEVADGLFEHGHAVAVLTSTYGSEEPPQHPYPVHRWLHLDPDWQRDAPAMWQFFVGRKQRACQSVAQLHRLVEDFAPDAIFVWHYIGLPRVLLQAAEQLSEIPVIYYLAAYHPELPDEYAAFWRAPPVHPLAKLAKPALSQAALTMLEREGKPVRLRYDHVICVSDYVRERLVKKGLISPDAVTIHNGVDLSQFASEQQEMELGSTQGLRCLVAGHLKHEKGAHTVIEALAHLKQVRGLQGITLSLVGGGPSAYRAHLEALVDEHALHSAVTFWGQVPRDQMPAILRQHNALILPSEYDEPLARSMQEGMAMGLLVIGTTTGGSGELLKHRKTGLAFEAGDARSLAAQLQYALDDPAAMERYAQAGRREIKTHFTIERTVAQIEDYLQQVLDVQPVPTVEGR